MIMPIEFLRRIGPDPHANGARTVAVNGCPDIFELQSGDFAVIGIDITNAAAPKLPPTAGCGPDERIVQPAGTSGVTADIPNRRRKLASLRREPVQTREPVLTRFRGKAAFRSRAHSFNPSKTVKDIGCPLTVKTRPAMNPCSRER